MPNITTVASLAFAGVFACANIAYSQDASPLDSITTTAPAFPVDDAGETTSGMTTSGTAELISTEPANNTESTTADLPVTKTPETANLRSEVPSTTSSLEITSSTLSPHDEASTTSLGTHSVPVEDTATSVTLPEGVSYTVVKPGTGAKAETSSTMLIHYTLYLTNGQKLESSRDAIFPVPFQFTVGRGDAIRGMELGTAGMKVGEMRKLYVPAELGYGESGQGENIPPNADLVFDVELVDVK